MHWYKIAKTEKTQKDVSSFEKNYGEQVEKNIPKRSLPFNAWFGGQDRITIPFKRENPIDIYEIVDRDVEHELKDNGYIVSNYKLGKCIDHFRHEKDIVVALEQIKNEKIHEQLNKIKREHPEVSPEIVESNMRIFTDESHKIEERFNTLKTQFENNPYRINKKTSEYNIVFSQNPYDIMKMSTGRNWTSCLDFFGRGYNISDQLWDELQNGGFVAYLTYTNDTSIMNPVARIWIRHFMNEDGRSIAVPEDEVYGDAIPGFLRQVKQWIDSRQYYPTGVYKLHGAEYSDTFDNEDQWLTPDMNMLDEQEMVKWFTSYKVNNQKNVRDQISRMVLSNPKRYSPQFMEYIKNHLIGTYGSGYSPLGIEWMKILIDTNTLTLEDADKFPSQIGRSVLEYLQKKNPYIYKALLAKQGIKNKE